MKKWIKTQTVSDPVSYSLLENRIGENWSGEYCEYCKNFSTVENNFSCDKCPLYSGDMCCDGLWGELNASETWGEALTTLEKA